MPVWCFQLGGGRLCSCGVLPALRGSSVPVWCDSSWEGVVCASEVFLRVVYVFLWVICASVVCFSWNEKPYIDMLHAVGLNNKNQRQHYDNNSIKP